MIPGFIIALVTFPGVIVHEMAHQFFCRLFRTAVLDVCYIRVGDPSGYVEHEIPREPAHSVWIAVGPFFVNTLLGAFLGVPAVIPIQMGTANPLHWVLLYFAVSIAMHAFPSTGDARSIWDVVRGSDSSWLLKIVATPIVGLIYLGALGSFFWLDLLFGIAVVLFVPQLLVQWIA